MSCLFVCRLLGSSVGWRSLLSKGSTWFWSVGALVARLNNVETTVQWSHRVGCPKFLPCRIWTGAGGYVGRYASIGRWWGWLGRSFPNIFASRGIFGVVFFYFGLIKGWDLFELERGTF